MAEINIEAEESVLGSYLIDGNLFKTSPHSPGHFTDYRVYIFGAMRDLDKSGEVIDLVTVTTRLADARKLEDVGGAGYLSSLYNSVPTTVNVDHHERLVLEAWKVRTSKKAIRERGLEAQTPEEIDDLISSLVKINDAGQVDTGYDHDQELVDIMEELATPIDESSSIKTGLDDLDKLLGQLEGGQFIVIGARPSIGKTAFALNITRNAAKRGTFVQFYSLETKKRAIQHRLLSAEARVPATKIRRRNFDEEDWTRISSVGMAGLSGLPIHIRDKFTSTVAAIRANARVVMKDNPHHRHLILIDYLQLLQGKGGNRTEEVSEISRALKMMANDLNVPVIALSQLSRAVEQRQDKHPQMSDLRESGAIEQDADIIGFLYRDEYYNPESDRKNILEVIIAKNRDGETGVVELVYLKQFNLVQTMERVPSN